jgi:NADPH:quinone reductase-like Zn-dependent oxidoreductase
MLRFPLRLGFDLAGTIVEIGSSVKNFAVGDEIFACLVGKDVGAWSEFAVVPARVLALKPKNLSFNDAASLPVVAMTGLQALEKVPGGLEGKTVLVAAGRT